MTDLEVIDQLGVFCEQAINQNGVVCDFGGDHSEIAVTFGEDDHAKVIIDEFDETCDPPGTPWAGHDAKDARKATDRTSLLDVILVALAKSGLKITDMSSDGDHKDCEAIFAIDDVWYIIKVR